MSMDMSCMRIITGNRIEIRGGGDSSFKIIEDGTSRK